MPTKLVWAAVVVAALWVLACLPVWAEEPGTIPPRIGTLTLTSDRLEYGQDEGIYHAEGNVTLTRDTLELRVHTLTFNDRTRQVLGAGDVSLRQSGNILSAARMEYNLLTDQGTLWDGRLVIGDLQYIFTGKQITRLNADRYTLKEASFTACDCPDDPDWRIRADSINVTLDRYITAKNLVFYANEWPILILPYMVYPANTTRQSGLLVPEMGYSRQSGIRYRQELFLAPVQNQDATLSLDFRDRKGSGGGLEYRYAFSEAARGALQAYRFHDREQQIDRTGLHYRHTQRFSNRTVLNLNVQEIDPKTPSDLLDTTAERARQVLESTAHLTYTGNGSFAYLLARDTEDLVDPANRFGQLPEVGWRLMEHPVGPFYYGGGMTYTRFTRAEEIPWERVDLSQKVSIPFQIASGLTFTPWAGARPVGYNTNPADEPFYRNITATGVHLHGDWGQTVRLAQDIFYEEVQAEDSSGVIEVDDIDRLHDRQSVTLSINPQFSTLLALSFSESYETSEFVREEDRYSDLRGALTFYPLSALSLEMEGFYDWETQTAAAANADFNFSVRERFKISAGRYYASGSPLSAKGDPFNPFYLGNRVTTPRENAIRGEAGMRLGRQFRLAGQVFYDQDDNRALETHYGLLYLKQCVSAALVYQKLKDRDEFFFTVHLQGLGPLIPKRFAHLFDF